MSAEPLRLVPLDRLTPETEKATCCNCHGPHPWAVSELVVRKNGEIVKRLVNTSAGFVKVLN